MIASGCLRTSFLGRDCRPAYAGCCGCDGVEEVGTAAHIAMVVVFLEESDRAHRGVFGDGETPEAVRMAWAARLPDSSAPSMESPVRMLRV